MLKYIKKLEYKVDRIEFIGKNSEKVAELSSHNLDNLKLFVHIAEVAEFLEDLVKINVNLIPTIDNAKNIGSADKRWNNVYADKFVTQNTTFTSTVWWSGADAEIRSVTEEDKVFAFHSTGARMNIAIDGGLAILHEDYESTPFGDSAWKFVNDDMIGGSGNNLHIRSNWDWIYIEPDLDESVGESGIILRRSYDGVLKERVRIGARDSGAAHIVLTGKDANGNWGFVEWVDEETGHKIHWKGNTTNNDDRCELYYWDGSGWNLWKRFNNVAEYGRHHYPFADNAYDLGSSSLRWANIHGFKIKAHGDCVIPTSQPESPEAGSMYFDPASSKLYIYDGSAWKSISLT